MSRFLIATTRLLLSAWVGGAGLFVITSVAEQRSPEFSSVIRDQLATIRFPLYYLFAVMTLVPATLLLILCLCVTSTGRLKSVMLAAMLSLASASIAGIDYVFVYRPLQALITPVGKARGQEFIALHNRSRQINEVHVSLALIAAIVVCSVRIPDSQTGTATGNTSESCPTD
jgi:hypothetical protein